MEAMIGKNHQMQTVRRFWRFVGFFLILGSLFPGVSHAAGATLLGSVSDTRNRLTSLAVALSCTDVPKIAVEIEG